LLQRDFKLNSQKTQKELHEERNKMGLIITHTGFILDYMTADKGQVLYKGELTCSSNPGEIFTCISEMGYEECVRCAT
jgi:Fe-S cluster assembly ATP-binding protein